jgi:hypothetical protein
MFELPDNEKMCFHEVVEKGVKCTLEFQVNSDVQVTGVIGDFFGIWEVLHFVAASITPSNVGPL